MFEDSEAFREELKHARDQTEHILKLHPSARNSDTILYLYWLRYFGKLDVIIPYIPPQDVHRIETAISTIPRVRRKFQEKGLYPCTDPEVEARRNGREKSFRKHMPG